jgi:hypothetical protein
MLEQENSFGLRLFFIFGLFSDSISFSDYIASNGKMITGNEFERKGKEAVVI